MPVGSVINNGEKNNFMHLNNHHVQSEPKRGLDALSVSERPYYRPDNNCFVKSEEQGLVPLFRVYGFGIDEFVKFKNRPFSGRFGVKFGKLYFVCIGIRG